MARVTLFEEYRFIERNVNEVSGAWKGAHLLLFFLAFVFGSFCTFCFHLLMYLFDEKCVLFPKLLSLTSLRHNVIYEFIPEEKERVDSLPVDFLSTQWVEKSACYLPTYVPLVSGIFGLVWTTMFLMCSSGGRSLGRGLQRSWRIIPIVFVFSIPMSCLCIYSSSVTHDGLQELCVKLGEISGSSTCSYTVNVATLTYERQIRGVYQATRLTIASAWLHTFCWVASAVLALARVLLAIDFRLVKVRVELIGDIDKMLERNEQHLRTVMPNQWADDDDRNASLSSAASTEYFFNNEQYSQMADSKQLTEDESILYISNKPIIKSELSLLPEEQIKLARIEAYQSVHKNHRFIVKMLYDLLDKLIYSSSDTYASKNSNFGSATASELIPRQLGQFTILSRERIEDTSLYTEPKDIDSEEAQILGKEIIEQLQKRLVLLDQNKLTDSLVSLINKVQRTSEGPNSSLQPARIKTNLKRKGKSIGIQTTKLNKKQKVTILESKSTFLKTLEHDVNLPSTSKKVYKKNDSEKREYIDSEEKSAEHVSPKISFLEQKKKHSEQKASAQISEEQEIIGSDENDSVQKYSEEQEKKDHEKKDYDKKDPKQKD